MTEIMVKLPRGVWDKRSVALLQKKRGLVLDVLKGNLME